VPACVPRRGTAVQVDPTKPKLKAPGPKRVKLQCDVLLSNFAFNVDLRRYNVGTNNQELLADPGYRAGAYTRSHFRSS